MPGLYSTESQSGSIRSCRVLPPVRLTWIPTTASLAGRQCHRPMQHQHGMHLICRCRSFMVSRRHPYAESVVGLPGMQSMPCMAHPPGCKQLEFLCTSVLTQALEITGLVNCRSIVEVGAYNAVKNATCSKQCLEGGLLQACPAQAPVPAPSPAYAQALAALQAGAPAPGASSGGALNGLSSALQAGSPPRYPPEAGPQVPKQKVMIPEDALPSHVNPETLSMPLQMPSKCHSNVPSYDIASLKKERAQSCIAAHSFMIAALTQAISSYADGGYGNYGIRGGYGQRLPKPQPPPSGLAAQSLSETQVIYRCRCQAHAERQFLRSVTEGPFFHHSTP